MKKIIALNLTHWLLRLTLPLAVVIAVYHNLFLVAYSLVILFKWRAFITSQHWFYSRLRSNLVDIIFGGGLVLFMSYQPQNVIALGLWGGIFFLWVVAIKPQKTVVGHIAQGLIGYLVATSALIYSQQYPNQALPLGLILVLSWLISYFTTRHMLTNFSPSHFRTYWPWLLSLVATQLLWVLLHWQIYLWLIPQFIFLVVLINLPVIIGYYLKDKNKLTNRLVRQLVTSVIIVLVANLVLTDWQIKPI